MGRRRKRLPDELFEGHIEDLSHDGRGVTRLEGKTVFVHGALPGETVRYRLTGRSRKFDTASAEEIVKASPDRVEPRCEHFGVCGGCVLQHQAPTAQILAKQQVLVENLRRIGDVSPETLLEPLTGPVWAYRRKARLSVRHVYKKEKVLVGFRERQGRYVADLDRCHILPPEVGFRLNELGDLILGMTASDRIPQVEVACGDDNTVLVFRHLDPLDTADQERLAAWGRDHDMSIYLQPGGEDTVHPLGDGVELNYHIDDLRFRFESGDFIQVNDVMNRAMVGQAISLLDLSGDENVLDLFCGLGNFSLPMARQAAQVVGIEGDAALVAKARDNAAANDIENTEFHRADLREDHRGAAWLQQDYQRVLLDPPRSGAEDVLPALVNLGAERMVYVSCHPGSLARDAGLLVHRHGYRLHSAGVMDMFPHTAHVESMALFVR